MRAQRFTSLPAEVERYLMYSLKSPRFYRGEIKACCPFHDEDTPSFFVYDSSDQFFYHCFGCGAKGTLGRLLRHQNQYEIAQLLPADKVYRKEKPDDPQEVFRLDSTRGFADVYDYFQSRGLSADFCKEWGFKMDLLSPAAIMPVYTRHRYKGFIARSLHPAHTVRYYIEPNMDIASSLWGFDRLDAAKPVYITEGIIDAATMWMEGRQAVALCGKRWEGKADLLKPFECVCIPDNGDIQSMRLFTDLANYVGGRVLRLPYQYKDVNEYALAGDDFDEFLNKNAPSGGARIES